MLCVEWVYALVPIPGVYILPCLVQYAWFIPSDCVAKFRYSSGLIELMSNSSCPAKRNHRGRDRGPKQLNSLHVAVLFYDFLVFWA